MPPEIEVGDAGEERGTEDDPVVVYVLGAQLSPIRESGAAGRTEADH